MRIVLDVSVAIASTQPTEPAFRVARRRVTRAIQGDDHLLLPPLFAVEVGAALARVGARDDAIRALVQRLTSDPHEVITFGRGRAEKVMELAIRLGLRGADAFYVWLAASEHVPLCTLDREMARCASTACKVIAP